MEAASLQRGMSRAGYMNSSEPRSFLGHRRSTPERVSDVPSSSRFSPVGDWMCHSGVGELLSEISGPTALNDPDRQNTIIQAMEL